MKNIGTICKNHRERLGITQNRVAKDVGCSVKNVSAFENNRNRSLRVFCWYLFNGLDIREENYNVKEN